MTDHPHLSWWSLYWLAWLLAFLIPELWWVFRNPLYTLSDTVWSIEGVNFAQPFDLPMWTATHWAVAIAVWLLFGWLSLHFPFGMLR